MRVCVCACVRVCVGACVRVCVCACVRWEFYVELPQMYLPMQLDQTTPGPLGEVTDGYMHTV